MFVESLSEELGFRQRLKDVRNKPSADVVEV